MYLPATSASWYFFAASSLMPIVVSADATPGQVERLTALGAQAYLTKPLNVKHLVRLIEELLGEKEI